MAALSLRSGPALLKRIHGCLLKPREFSRVSANTAHSNSVTEATLKEAEPPSRIPGSSILQSLARVFLQGYFRKMHELQIYEKKMYGPMWTTTLGPYKHINLASVELIEELMRKDEKYPRRADMSIWTDHRDIRDLGYGPFTEEGKKWYNLRAILNNRMLRPKDSALYETVINDVVTDFMKRIYYVRETSTTGDMVHNMANELYKFSLEGISMILFESRIGCLESEVPADTQGFINSIAKMMSYSVFISSLPKWTRQVLPFWKHYVAGWDGIFDFTKKLVDKKMDEIQSHLMKGEEIKGEYLTYLLSNGKLATKDVYGSVAELLLAGVDTTSNTMTFALYELSRNLAVQNALYHEVQKQLPNKKIPTVEDISNMPLLKAVIKETLRMYPVVTTNARSNVEKEVMIGGHWFPKNTLFVLCHYAISHDEDVFPEHWKFIPDRWLRDGRARPNPFGSVPFGYGVRGCAGRRIAELEMHLLLARIIQHFEILPDSKMGEIKSHNRIVLVADRPVNLHFVERHERSSFNSSQDSDTSMHKHMVG
ncbi:sterol 26-hydroxylase, mitochondrial-like [Polypterus senegalus]|uniref:sterol 26-hydroxylase, mitochondrial-like n=1 Tax=Polypterus senegalus TaxID=55291 RepID=UPI001964908A|nr:sterol 26-hydroxylase, mitochondrial-like [Polypterus senegalus]